MFQTPNNNLLMSSVPRNRLGVGSSVLSIVRSVGYSVGAALAAAIVSAQLAVSTGQSSLQVLSGATAEIHSSGFAAFMRGFRLALSWRRCCVSSALQSARCGFRGNKYSPDQFSPMPSRPMKGSLSAGRKKSMPKLKPSRLSSNPSSRDIATPNTPSIDS